MKYPWARSCNIDLWPSKPLKNDQKPRITGEITTKSAELCSKSAELCGKSAELCGESAELYGKSAGFLCKSLALLGKFAGSLVRSCPIFPWI